MKVALYMRICTYSNTGFELVVEPLTEEGNCWLEGMDNYRLLTKLDIDVTQHNGWLAEHGMAKLDEQLKKLDADYVAAKNEVAEQRTRYLMLT